MTADTGRDNKPPQTNDASSNALEREKAAPSGDIPVKQHNPGDKGINPDQRGPAQPSGSQE